MPSKLTLSKETLMDKIKGGWAGQVIGCTYGGPTEFRWRAKMIPDSENIPWGEPDYIVQMMKRQPGLYDDIYMDLTFVESFERLGIDAPVDSIALAFAHAKYPLWHANQVARHNILYGIMLHAVQKLLEHYLQRYRSGHNGADSKSVCRYSIRHVGSNPTLSANENRELSSSRFFCYSVELWKIL